MTDEQVERIVQALQGSGEFWTSPLLLTAVGALIGFGLSQLQETINRRRKRLDDADALRRGAAQNAIAHTAWVLGLSPGHILANASEMLDRRISISTSIMTISVPVSTWWGAQLACLIEGATDQPFTTEEMTARTVSAAKTVTVLSQWADGKLDEAYFRQALQADKTV